MTRWLALLALGCSASSLPADHPCKAENSAAFIAECSAKVTAACAESEEACQRQEAVCNAELESRCAK